MSLIGQPIKSDKKKTKQSNALKDRINRVI